MKSCPTCLRLYPDDAGFCPVEGVGLLGADQVPVPPSADDPRLGGTLCARYQIRRVVADGGMGRVYEALDLREQLRVAIKVLHSDVSHDEVAVERFKREFQVSNLVPHTHIVEVRDFASTEDGNFALVMEFLDGEELRMVLRRDRHLRPERVVRLLSQTAIGLDQAHRQQLVHRDLKPDNLFLCGTHEGDRVKILDFGSVKDKSSNAKKLTVVGTTIGSPFYMAPEQAQGLETLDARADVFAMAAITYECLTGSVPFRGTSGPGILLAILTQDPEPPSAAAADAPIPVPPTMDDVIEVALAKNPAIRTRTVGELADGVGRAYGLSGDHLDWAHTPESALRDAIAPLLSRLKAAPRPVRPAARPEASFTGGVLTDPFAAPVPDAIPMDAPRPLVPASRVPSSSIDLARAEEEALALVASGRAPRWWIPLLTGVVVVLIGLLAVRILGH